MKYTITNNDTTINWGLKGNDRIAQNVLNIIRTRATEIPFLRELGINYDYLDANIGYLRTHITNDIIELINKYESRADVLSVEISGYDDNGNAIIQVEVEVE